MRQVWAFVLGVLGVLSAAAWVEAKEGGNPVVLMKTSMGDIKIELDKAKAPVTVENFLVYVNDKFYDGTIFHRVIPAFMIQGGGFDKDMKQKKTNAPIKNEAGNGLKNLNGTIAMARTSDPNSATAQFFINTKDNAFLDHKQRDRAGLRLRGVRQGGRRHGRGEEDRAGADHYPRAASRTCRSRR